MPNVTYVLPDSLSAPPAPREALALQAGCDIVEVGPADSVPPSLPWLLRLSSIDEHGRDLPRWYDRTWTTALAGSLAPDTDRAPEAVTIEPGSDRNRLGDLVRAIGAIHGALFERFGTRVPVLIANRADQALPDGAALAEFWEYLARRAPDLVLCSGIALDASELYTTTRTRMVAELGLLSPASLRYLRLHTRGRKPDLNDPLPWRTVLGLVRKAPGTVLIAPAVRDPAQLEPAILFCMVNLQERPFT